MVLNKHKLEKLFLIVLSAIIAGSATTDEIFAATAYQQCLPNSTCVVGEYLYDDTYVPITTATCTLSSRNPDGTVFINTAAMTAAAQNDGWYSYAVDTTSKANGIYRSQVCCTSGTDYMCLDKTYEITDKLTSTDVKAAVWDEPVASHNTAGTFGSNLQTAAPTAVQIWSSPDRSLTDFGSLIGDIWSYSTRSLNSFSSLITGIWSSPTRTLSSGTLDDGSSIATRGDLQVATASAVAGINSNSNTNTSTLNTAISGVQSTANTINGKVDTLTTNLDSATTKIDTLISKWGVYSAGDIITNVGSVQTSLGSSSDGCAATTLYGYANCAKQKWGVNTADDLLLATNNVATTAAALRSELNYNGKSSTAYSDLQTLLTNLGTVTTNLGTVSTNVLAVSSTANTINGKADTISTQVLGVKTTADSIEGKVDLLQIASDAIKSVVDSITTVVNTINGKATSIQNTADAINTKTDTLQTTSNTIKTTTDRIEATSSAILSKVNLIQTTADSISGKADAISVQVTGVQSTASNIDTHVNSITTNLGTVSTNVGTLITKWGSYNASDIITNVGSVQTNLGSNSDGCEASTLYGYANCAKQKWGVKTADDLLLATNNVATTAAALRSELNYNGKSTTAYEDLQSLLTNLGTVSTNLNTVSTNVSTVNSTANSISSATTSINSTVGTLNTKIDTLTTKVDTLSSTVGTINTNVGTLITKWGSYNMSDVITNVTAVQTQIGNSSNICSDPTVFGAINCINPGGSDNSAILTAATNAATQSAALRSELDFNGKSSTAYTDLQLLKSNITTMQTLIGSSSDTASSTTLFGGLKKTQDQISTLNTSGAGLTDLLDKWGSYSATDIYDKVKDLSSQIASVNTISNVSNILNLTQTNETNINSLKNAVLELNALTLTNKTILEEGKNKPVVTTWLEEGSVVFKTLLTNPSGIKQTVPIKFYLPKEANKEDVLKIDDTLTIGYDPIQDATYVTGEYVLLPKETKVVAIEVTDIWKVPKTDIQSLRLQAQQLFEPMKNTAFFAQATTLKADVDSALDAADQEQQDAQTPEARIKAYRVAVAQIAKAKQDINGLQILVTNVSSQSALHEASEFGSPYLLVFGLIGLAVLLFFFLKSKEWNLSTEKRLRIALGASAYVALVLMIAIGFKTLAIQNRWFTSSKPTIIQKAAEQPAKETPKEIGKENPKPTATPEVKVLGAKTTPGSLVKVITVGNGVKVHEGPSAESTVTKILHQDTDAEKVGASNGWIHITWTKAGTENEKLNGWVSQEFLEVQN